MRGEEQNVHAESIRIDAGVTTKKSLRDRKFLQVRATIPTLRAPQPGSVNRRTSPENP
jgi:hypothetical protein